MTRLRDAVKKINQDKGEDPGRVGIYLTSLKRFKKFQKLCSPVSASAVIDLWIAEAVAEEDRKKK